MSSSTTDYSKFKVTELREALQKRNLPITGVKSELVARLTAADASADAPSPAANKSHLPTADDYDVDWDDNDDPAPAAAAATSTTTTTTTTANATAAPATATATTPKPESASASAAVTPAPTEPAKPKKKFASIAALFDTPAPATTTPAKPKDGAATQNSQSPSSPSTVTDEAATSTIAATTSAPKPKAEEPSFAAGLSASSLDVELERRKARAKRFGIEEDVASNESTKKLEREKRFGNATTTTEDTTEKKEVVKGLDSALPEHRRERKRGAPVAQDTRGGKRARGGNNGAGRGEQRSSQRRAQAPAAGVQKKAYKGVLDDPTEKAKAEARARKFGVA